VKTGADPRRNDMQYAFSYYYFLMHERKKFDFDQVWHEVLDTDYDGCGALSFCLWWMSCFSSIRISLPLSRAARELNDNEQRTLAAIVGGLPIPELEFWDIIKPLLITGKVRVLTHSPPPVHAHSHTPTLTPPQHIHTSLFALAATRKLTRTPSFSCLLSVYVCVSAASYSLSSL
jgi:hypothetical protein